VKNKIVSKKVGGKELWPRKGFTYRLAGENEGKSAPKMGEEDESDGDEHNDAIYPLVRAFEKPEVADEKRNLEEADAKLVKRATCVVDSCKRDEVFLGPERDGQAETVFSF